MATIKVNLGRPLDLFGNTEDALLTTDHPASSYGLPVVVLDGQPMGPADLDGREIRPALAVAPEYAAWLAKDAAARRDGLDRPADYTGPRWQDGAEELLAGARRAGYRIEEGI